MQTLRLYAWNLRTAYSRLTLRHVLAVFLVVIVPGGLVVPICCGIYGALRHTLTGKVAPRSADSGPAAVMPEASQR